MTYPPPVNDLISIPHVCTVTRFVGDRAAPDAPGLLIEVPHGATEAAHYFELAARMQSDLPANLERFFFVNTDVGAPEVAQAIAAAHIAGDPTASVTILRCLIPRTLIDCNRIIDADPAQYAEGGVTPGIAPYVDHPGDRALLLSRYAAYQEQATAAFAQACGRGGRAVMLHTYAPKTVGIKTIDRDIVTNLAAVYAPDAYATWPTRPEADLLTATPEGTDLSDRAAVDGILAGLRAAGIAAGEGATYPLHPVTTAYHHAARYPGQTVCMEIRRDMLVDFVPFVPLHPDPAKVVPIGAAIAAGLSC
ncbi:MAG: putative N-formylglutamate amidohydrolase [Myxococcota bacterium]|jgi:predicted N-formylglutamate amidohydrolase